MTAVGLVTNSGLRRVSTQACGPPILTISPRCLLSHYSQHRVSSTIFSYHTFASYVLDRFNTLHASRIGWKGSASGVVASVVRRRAGTRGLQTDPQLRSAAPRQRSSFKYRILVRGRGSSSERGQDSIFSTHPMVQRLTAISASSVPSSSGSSY